MGIIKLLFRLLWAAFEIADAAVHFVGGWAIVWGAGWAMLTALWGLAIEAGPVTIPVAFAAAAAAMIFFDALKFVYLASTKAKREKVEIAKKLGDLSCDGEDLIYRSKNPGWKKIPQRQDFWDWMNQSISTVEKTNLSEEFYGLKSISDPEHFQKKLRVIAMRFMKENKIPMTEINRLGK
ncbi:MAG: hypothetical protein RIE84_14645 [Parvibaculum sp.]|uniref:hypothetical protein n=1 Tax=Parvibaculum sp. TaxID=2024848 RepID=UPI0032ED9FF4